MEIDDITGIIIARAMEIHKNPGPGVLESVYEAVPARLLEQSGLKVERQKAEDSIYEGYNSGKGSSWICW